MVQMKWNNLEDNLIDKQNKKRLFSLINKLPLLYEIVILEHYFDNKTINEIAKKV
jgi:DNA-directed RNA polymerase specialized sigma24 family protein